MSKRTFQPSRRKRRKTEEESIVGTSKAYQSKKKPKKLKSTSDSVINMLNSFTLH